MLHAADRVAVLLAPIILAVSFAVAQAGAQPKPGTTAAPTDEGASSAPAVSTPDSSAVSPDETVLPGSEPTSPSVGRLPELDPSGRSVDSAAAESLFNAGRALMDSGHPAEACPKFEASFRAEPSGGTLLNLALCHQLQGRTASAWAEYRRAADMIRALGQQERADEAMRYALELEPRLSQLAVSVTGPVPGLRVLRGGVPLVDGAWGVGLPVDPGRHRLIASAPGYQSWSTDVEIGANGDRKAVAVPPLRRELPSARPATVPSKEGTAPGYLAGLVIGATGLVSLGVGAVLGIVASNDIADAESDETLCGVDRLCTPAGEDVVARARTEAHISTLAFGIGAAMAASGIVLVLVTLESGTASSEQDDADASAAVALQPWLGPAEGGLVFGGSF
jgi:hypothetical protein